MGCYSFDRTKKIIMLIQFKIAIFKLIPFFLIGFSLASEVKISDVPSVLAALASSEVSDQERLQIAIKALDSIEVTDQADQTYPIVSPREAAQILRIIGHVPYVADSSVYEERIASRKKALAELKLAPSFSSGNFHKINSKMLVLSEALLGVSVNQSGLLNVVSDENVDNYIRLVAAEALLAQPQLDAASKQVFFKLAEESWSYLEGGQIGSPQVKKLYPFRVIACEALSRLGVKCRIEYKQEASPDSEFGTKFFETIIVFE